MQLVQMFIIYAISAACMVASTVASPTNMYFQKFETDDCSDESTSLYGMMLNTCMPNTRSGSSSKFMAYTSCTSTDYQYSFFDNADCSDDATGGGIASSDYHSCYKSEEGFYHNYRCDDHAEPWTMQPGLTYHTETFYNATDCSGAVGQFTADTHECSNNKNCKAVTGVATYSQSICEN